MPTVLSAKRRRLAQRGCRDETDQAKVETVVAVGGVGGRVPQAADAGPMQRDKLLQALKVGDFGRVPQLHQVGADVNACDDSGDPLLKRVISS